MAKSWSEMTAGAKAGLGVVVLLMLAGILFFIDLSLRLLGGCLGACS